MSPDNNFPQWFRVLCCTIVQVVVVMVAYGLATGAITNPIAIWPVVTLEWYVISRVTSFGNQSSVFARILEQRLAPISCRGDAEETGPHSGPPLLKSPENTGET